MRWLIYSDVHGNLPAFEAMLEGCEYDRSLCLGDLVNYGPWSNECVELAATLKDPVLLMGNHEEAFLAGAYPGSNELVKQFFAVTYPAFHHHEKIKAFEPRYLLGDKICEHTFDNRYIYPDTVVELQHDYLIGHSHHQFELKSNGHTLINVGSVGQNRKYINIVNYALYDDETGQTELMAKPYDLSLLVQKMKALKYPDACVNYYLNKAQYVL